MRAEAELASIRNVDTKHLGRAEIERRVACALELRARSAARGRVALSCEYRLSGEIRYPRERPLLRLVRRGGVGARVGRKAVSSEAKQGTTGTTFVRAAVMRLVIS